MKNAIKIFSFIVGLISFSACTDDDFAGSKTNSLNIVDGLPVSLSFDFMTDARTQYSRVVQPDEAEYTVNEIYVFFLQGDNVLAQGSPSSFTDGTYSNGNKADGRAEQLAAKTGKNLEVFAVANTTANGISKTELDAVKTRGALRNLIVRMDIGTNVNRSQFIMTGQFLNAGRTEETSVVSIDKDDNNNAILYDSENAQMRNPTIRLRRMDSRITFNVSLGTITGEEAGVTVASGTATFTPRTFEVHNIPQSTYIFNPDKAEVNGQSYNSMNSSSALSFDTRDEKGNSSFNFYLYENYKDVTDTGAEQYITAAKQGTAENLYALREKKNGVVGDDGTDNRTFVYAPEHATYVVFRGDLAYERTKDGITQWVNASVSYTVHLGETGGEADWNNPTKVNNYTVARNKHYIYNVEITGVNSIRVEVTSESEEPRPGMEGDVIIAGAQVKALDSHFERTKIALTRAQIREGLSWAIQTVFDRGMYTRHSGTSNPLKDYKWVLFAINREFGLSASGMTDEYASVDLVKFPGFHAYDGGANTISDVPVDGTKDTGNNFNVNGTTYTWKSLLQNPAGPNSTEYQNAYYHSYAVSNPDYFSDGMCLRDINQLINYLTVKAEESNPAFNIFEEADGGTSDANPDNDVVYITAFVSENLYIYNPQTDEFRFPTELTSSDTEALLLWKKVVNKDPRMLHICVGEKEISSDGASSWSQSVVTIKQNPVYSVYNEDDAGLASAWGTEGIIETGPLKIIPDHAPTGSYKNTEDNGRANQLNFFVNSQNVSSGVLWGNVMNRTNSNLENENQLKSDYQDIWHACMTRNVDINGDNKIDPGEVRWFLASIDELSDLWIGEDAMVEEAKLYYKDGNGNLLQDGASYHLVSSTYNANGANNKGNQDYTNPYIIWAEEGASKGPAHQDGGANGAASTTKEYYYRCVRYLGLPFSDVTATPDDFVVPSESYKVTVRTADGTESVTAYQLDLSRLGAQAKRTVDYVNTELNDHSERGSDDNNKPYNKFEVLVSVPDDYEASNARYWDDDDDDDGNVVGFKNMKNPGRSSLLCPEGYRVPNQRELMLMYTTLNWGTSGRYWCSTKFSFNGGSSFPSGKRPGFLFDSGNLVLVNTSAGKGDGSNVAARVRCVRDVTE